MSAAFLSSVSPVRIRSSLSQFPAAFQRRPGGRGHLKVRSARIQERCTATFAASTKEERDSAGIRINKCFKSFASRRESDAFVEGGRVRINGNVATPGSRVLPGDEVELDGILVEWERLTVNVKMDTFTYIKHWKDVDVICTTDDTIPNNIIRQIPQEFKERDRLFPIGRLDESSTGLILLTSDGRLPNAILGAGKDCAKEYLVTPDMHVSDEDMEQLRQGVVIKTFAQRDGNLRKPLVASSLPCDVERQAGGKIMIRLQEGRNRQIRKMLGALGYTTRAIHRIRFMGMTLDGLSGPGDSTALTSDEMALIERKLRKTN